jgi:hypothetical protein
MNTTAPQAVTTSAGSPVGYIRSDGVSAVVYQTSAHHIGGLAWNGIQWIYTDLTAATGCPNASSTFRPRAYTRQDGFSAVVYVDGSSNVRELTLAPPNFTGWACNRLPNTKPVGSELSPFDQSDGTSTVLYVSTSEDHIHQLGLDPVSGTWFDADLTNASFGPLASGGTGAVSGYVRSDGWDSIVYKTKADGHVHLLAGNPMASWTDEDLTAASGGTL